MRSIRLRLLVFALFISFASVSITAQQNVATQPPNAQRNGPPSSILPPLGPPARDPEAVAIVEASLNAMGGAQIAQITDCTITAHVDPASNSNSRSGTLVYTLAGTEYRSDFTDAEGTLTIASGNGSPFATVQGKTALMTPHQFRANFAPSSAAIVLLHEFGDSNYSFIYKGTGIIGADAVSIIETSSHANRMDALVTPQTWYFTNSSHLPLRIEYRLPDKRDARHYVQASVDLSAYKNISGALFPFQITTSINGVVVRTTLVTSITTNSGVPSSTFSPPIGGVQ